MIWPCLVVLAMFPIERFALSLAAQESSIQDVQTVADEETTARAAHQILASRCLNCHGGTDQEAGLRLDTREGQKLGGESGIPAILPGRADASLLIERVKGDGPDGIMPPEGEPLTETEVHSLRQWIQQGAAMPELGLVERPTLPDHWSFQPLQRPHIPASTGKSLASNPIDRFIADRLREDGLHLAPKADRVTLIRRLYLVMLGLPPTHAEVDAFRSDRAPDAYERLVDRVMASPRLGERWASHWLDIARFGETDGFETNRERPNAYHYRDYVIRAFNDDLPYDEFVRQQLAGDQHGHRVGTGFLVAGPYDIVKSPDRALTLMQRQDELADIVNTTGTAFLGLTIGCARCHNHKFDPISQRDYYATQAVFAGVQHGNAPLPLDPVDSRRRSDLRLELQELVLRLSPQLQKPQDGLVLISDQPVELPSRRGMVSLKPPRGSASHFDGPERGQLKDSGAVDRLPNLGRSYHWWDNQPGEVVAAYRMLAKGDFRIWLSWGCGWETHCRDAHYLLDRDGDIDTVDDRELIATVDQQLFADGTGNRPGQPLWSGFLDGGVHQLSGRELLLIQCGEQGTAVTADEILLEVVESPESLTSASTITTLQERIAPPVNSQFNVERFEPIQAKRIRFEIVQTSTGNEPGIDELEVYAGDENVAVAESVQVRVSGTIPGYEDIHQPHFVNDGKYSDQFSWISDTHGTGWVELKFPDPIEIDRVLWGRDRSGRFTDRVPSQYRILVSNEEGVWSTVASHEIHLAGDPAADRTPEYQVDASDHQEPLESEPEADVAELLDSLRAKEERLNIPAGSIQGYVGTFAQPPPTHRLHRGDPMSPREEVTAGALSAFAGFQLPSSASESARRAALAEWIVDTRNPLTARVMANRLWQHVFGQGLVSTPSDFGLNGVPPTHPELLDWLAAEMIQAGERDAADWSIKRLLRTLVLSHTFQQSAAPDTVALRVDADARLLWRFPPRRLTAESIRDSMVAVADVLNNQMHGPGYSAFEIDFENVRHYFPREQFDFDSWRRMIYMTKVRQEQDAVFGSFDCPDGSQVQPSRSRSTTPAQALNLFNSPFVNQQAEFLAARITEDLEATRIPLTNNSDKESETALVSQQVTHLFQVAYGRQPTPAEESQVVPFVRQHGLVQLCRVVLNSNEFLFIP